MGNFELIDGVLVPRFTSPPADGVRFFTVAQAARRSKRSERYMRTLITETFAPWLTVEPSPLEQAWAAVTKLGRVTNQLGGAPGRVHLHRAIKAVADQYEELINITPEQGEGAQS